MLWFILVMAFGIAVSLRETKDWGERVLYSLLFFLVGCLLALVPFLLCSVLYLQSKTTTTVTTTEVKLVSLRSVDQINGSFFLGSGSIGVDQYYFFYKDAGNGGYKLDKLRVDDSVTVFEENRQDGRLVRKRCNGEFLNRWYYLIGMSRPSSSCLHGVEFHIPQGSLQKRFQLE